MSMNSARRRSGTVSPLPTPIRRGAVWVSGHALDALRKVYTSVAYRDALELFHYSQEIERVKVQILTCRTDLGVCDRYFVSPGGEGAFVVASNWRPTGAPWVVVTWLRFGATQRHHAQRFVGAA